MPAFRRLCPLPLRAIPALWLVGFALPPLACAWGGLPSSAGQPRISEESGEPLDALPRVVRLHVSGAALPSLDDVWLVSGDVGSSTATKLVRREVPESVRSRRVPLAAWLVEDELVAAPLVVLEPSTTYTLFALGMGLLGTFMTTSEEPELWTRLGEGRVGPGGHLLFAAQSSSWSLVTEADDGEVPREPSVLTLEPSGPVVEARLGAIEPDDGTLLLTIDIGIEGGGTLLPPRFYGGRYFAPVPIELGAGVEIGLGGGATMEGGFGELGPSGELPSDAVVAAPASPQLWGVTPGEIVELELSAGAHVVRIRSRTSGEPPLTLRTVTSSRGTRRMGPLPPGTYELEWVAVGGGGKLERETVEFSVQGRGTDPVLTEILANPNGPEPDSEWVEIYNPGSSPCELGSYRIADSGAEAALPRVSLPPGRVGVIVAASYRADPALDVVPAPDAIPIIVEGLGKSGLLNSGEVVRLVRRDGTVASAIPALRADAGVSQHRIHPLAPDEVEFFAPPSAAPATPGIVTTEAH